MLLGAGTAMVYPTLLAVIGDVAHPAWRGRAVGVYRRLARPRLRRRRAHGRRRRRPVEPARSRLGRSRRQCRLGPGGRRPDVRDPPARVAPAQDEEATMAERAAKDALYGEFAAVGQGARPSQATRAHRPAGPGAAQRGGAGGGCGPRHEHLLGHLQTLREAGLVQTRREGKRIYYSLTGDDVTGLWDLLRRVAHHHRPHTEVARRAYLGPGRHRGRRLPRAAPASPRPARWSCSTSGLPRSTSAGTCRARSTFRWRSWGTGSPSFRATNRSSPTAAAEYCVLAHDAVRLLNAQGLHARRAADGMLEWRLAGLPVESGAA